MRTNGEIKAEAWKRLSGKWVKAMPINLIVIIFILLFQLFQYLFLPSFSLAHLGRTIFILIITSLIFYIGQYFFYMVRQHAFYRFVERDELALQPSITFTKNNAIMLIKASILVALLIQLWSIGGVIVVMLLSYASLFLRLPIPMFLVFLCFLGILVWAVRKWIDYSMVFFLCFEQMELGSFELIKASQRLVEGKRMKIFLFLLSFIGWYILCSMTFGILYLWIGSYVETAWCLLYEELKKDYIGV